MTYEVSVVQRGSWLGVVGWAGVSSSPSQWETQDKDTEQGGVGPEGHRDPEAECRMDNTAPPEKHRPLSPCACDCPFRGKRKPCLLIVMSSSWGIWFLGRWQVGGKDAKGRALMTEKGPAHSAC